MSKLSPTYKDRKPEDTINLAKSVLKKLGIKTKEKIYDSGIDDIYSVRLTMDGAYDAGSNGKGMSKIYARASAYAEFIERLANLSLYTLDDTKLDKTYYDAQPAKIFDFVDSPLLGVKQHNKKFLKDFNQIYFGGNKNCFTLPFKRIDSKKKEILQFPYPFFIFYSTNGMAAGNSYYEMAVQAISEIFERYALSLILTNKKKALLYENEKVLKIFPSLRRMYKSIKKRGYHVKIYDCSIGMNLPVFAVIIFNNSKERYSVSFGSHPNAEFAISRCFTEMFQGLSGARLKNSIYDKPLPYSDYNLQEIIHNGFGSFPKHFLNVKKLSNNYQLLTKVYHSNQEMYKHYLALLKKAKFPLYYRDASYLGLYAGQFIIPGISYTFIPDDFHLSYLYTRQKYYPLFNKFMDLNKNDQEMINALYDFFNNANLVENDLVYLSTYGKNTTFNYYLYFALTNAYCDNYKRANKYLYLIDGLNMSEQELNSFNKIIKIINSHNKSKIKKAFIQGNFARRNDAIHLEDRLSSRLLEAQKKYYLK